MVVGGILTPVMRHDSFLERLDTICLIYLKLLAIA